MLFYFNVTFSRASLTASARKGLAFMNESPPTFAHAVTLAEGASHPTSISVSSQSLGL